MKRCLAKMDIWIMAALAWATSTKAAFYVLNLIIFTAVIINPPTSIQGWLLVVVSEYYQGVALPGLGAASKRAEEVAREEGAITRQLLQETHDATLRELAEIKQMHQVQTEEMAELKEIHRDLLTRHGHVISHIEAVVQKG